MTKDVVVSLKGLQLAPEQQSDAVEVIAPGEYYIRNNKLYVLFDEIMEKAVDFSIQTATVEEIEDINILNAAMLAMKRAVEDMDTKPDVCLIDGNKTPEGLECPAIAVVKGDAKSQAVAAASILAKVARDRYMEQMAEQYPEYRFEKHKGYGTKLHYQMIDQYGPCGIHRMSFLKKYYAKKNGH